MGASALALSVAVLLSAQSEEPQLVVLPLEAEGVKPQLGLDAWKTVVQEIAKAKTKLHVGVSFQKELHDMLLGPAREQARDCGSNVDCLREIGRALDVSQLIAGKVGKDDVSLVAFDVATGAKLGSAKSPAGLGKAKVEAKAKAAAQALIGQMAAAGKKKGTAVASAPKETPRETKEPAPAVQPATASNSASSASADRGGELKQDPKQDRIVEPTPAPVLSSTVSTSFIRVAREQLTGVREVTIDGAVITPLSDGSILHRVAPGSHTLTLSRNDGSKESRDLFVQSGQTAEAVFGPPSIAQNASNSNATRVDAAPRASDDEDVTSTWWFWTAIATAVLAGGATTVVLAGGLKGGPSIPDNFGTVSGMY